MKKVKQLFLVCAMAFMLCGCYKANINITVHADGTADMSMEMLVSEQALNYMDASVDDLKESMMQSMDDDVKESTKITDVSKTIDDEKYVGFEMTYDLKDASPYEFKKIIKVKDDTITFIMDENEVSDLGNDELEDYSSMEGIEFNMNITMPGKILDHNVGEVDGNTVKIDLLTFHESKIEIKSEIDKSNNTLLIVGVVAAGVVIAGIAFFLIKKNKKKDHDESDDLRPIDPNAPVTNIVETEVETDTTNSVEETSEYKDTVEETSNEVDAVTDSTNETTANESEEK